MSGLPCMSGLSILINNIYTSPQHLMSRLVSISIVFERFATTLAPHAPHLPLCMSSLTDCGSVLPFSKCCRQTPSSVRRLGAGRSKLNTLQNGSAGLNNASLHYPRHHADHKTAARVREYTVVSPYFSARVSAAFLPAALRSSSGRSLRMSGVSGSSASMHRHPWIRRRHRHVLTTHIADHCL